MASSNAIFNTFPRIAQSLFPQSAKDYRVAESEEEAMSILKAVMNESYAKKE